MFPHERENRSHTGWSKVAVVTILAIATIWQCIGAWTDSQTTDEAVHLSAGYSYWQTNDHRVNPEHPPLFKLMAAAPLLFVPHLNFSTTSVQWKTAEEWGLGSQLLYQSGSPLDARWILMLGRIGPMCLWLLLGVLIACWVWRRWGAWAAVMSTGLYAFDPTFLGHGHLVTNDIAMAAVFVGTIMALERFVARPSWKWTFITVLVFGIAMVTKFSAIILLVIVPVILLVMVVPKATVLTWRWVWRLVIATLVITPLVIWTTYGFEVKRADTDPHISIPLTEAAQHVTASIFSKAAPLTRWLYTHGDPQTLTGSILQNVRAWPVPAYTFFVGLGDTAAHDYYGHTAFLLGQTSNMGWWYYFPVAMAVKIPIITLFILLLTVAIAFASWREIAKKSWRLPAAFWFIGFPPIVYLLWSLTSHINIGVRHAFPFMIFFPIWAGSVVSYEWFTARRAMWTALGVTIIIGLTALFAWPHTLGYFNALAGGTKNGHTILQDSNFDWDQDTWRLQSYIKNQHLTSYSVAIPGGRKDLFFPAAGFIPTDGDLQAGVVPHGIYFINAMALFDSNNPFHWLWNIKPTLVVGTTVYRYDFR